MTVLALCKQIYVKETDARSYLNFSSCHPNHIYSGTVYSQCSRLRRIINNYDRLKLRLSELCDAFIVAGYPKNMVQNISQKVLNTERNLVTNNIVEPVANIQTTQTIHVVSTFGCDDELVSTLKQYETDLLKTQSFKNSKKLFKYVKRTASSLRNMVIFNKSLALGKRFGITKPCNGRGCKCCKMLCEEPYLTINGNKVKTAPGNCHSYNIIYIFQCKLCYEGYFGRTTRQLNERIREHRQAFFKVIEGGNIDNTKDDFSLGLHLYNNHGINERKRFDKAYTIAIVEYASSYKLEIAEHKYIHKYRTVRPNGINTQNPFGIPFLT